MGSYKKYRTETALEKKINEYFNSISRTVTAKEKVDTGKRDKKGHAIFEIKPILNDLGQEIKYREYILPPSISALCVYLGISKQTWTNYSAPDKFLDSTTRARARVEAYLNGELNSRLKGTDGIKFDLMQNFGWREKIDVTDNRSVEQYLKDHPGTGQDEF